MYGGDEEYFEEYYEDVVDDEEDQILVPEKKIETLKLPPLPPPPNINPVVPQVQPVTSSFPVSDVSIRQWTDEKGYTWRIEGNNPANWWDGTSWKEV